MKFYLIVSYINKSHGGSTVNSNFLLDEFPKTENALLHNLETLF